MTLPRDPWATSYGTDSAAAVPDTPPSAHDGRSAGPRLPPLPEFSPSGRGGRTGLIIGLVVTVAVSLGGAAAVGLWFLDDLGSPPGPVPAATATAAAPDEIGEPPVPIAPTGIATLVDPAITTAKAPHHTAGEWCSLLTAEDIRAATGFDQRGAPDSTLLCTHYFADVGYLFVSDIPAMAGAAYTVRGNSAILYQSEPTSCEVSVALNRGGGVLDIDVRGVHSPRVPLCAAAVDLAGRAFDRLPRA